MTISITRTLLCALGLTVVTATSACAGTDGEAEITASQSALQLDLSESVPAAAWQGARAGCGAELPKIRSFAVADLRAGLIAGRDASGRVICVDTVEEVRADLEAVKADPYPQPNRPVDPAIHGQSTPTSADPYPQPNMPTGADPYPQPNKPTGADPYPQPNTPAAPAATAPMSADPYPQPNSPTPPSNTATTPAGTTRPAKAS